VFVVNRSRLRSPQVWRNCRKRTAFSDEDAMDAAALGTGQTSTDTFIEGETVAETRIMPSPTLDPYDAIPKHKRHLWRAIEGDKPTHDPTFETLTGPTYVIEPARVLRVWTVVRRARDEQVAAIKAECQRRIHARYPQWKQANMTARGVELQDLWRAVGSWTAAEQAEADTLKAA
jgi:hypothetical protein